MGLMAEKDFTSCYPYLTYIIYSQR